MIRGEKIKYFREKNNLTQKNLAAGICSIPYLSKLENNNIVPSDEILGLLCERLKINLNEIAPKETLELLRKEIHEWYEVIKLRDKTGSELFFNQLNNNVQNIDDIEILSLFQLMSARHFILAEQYDQAYYYLTAAYSLIRYTPKSIEKYYYYFRGLYEFLNGNIENALEFYLMIKKYMDEPEYFYHLGLIYTKMNRITLSISYTERALIKFNENIVFFRVIDCYILLGINYNRIKEYEQAINYLHKALRAGNSLQNSENVMDKIHHNLGCVFQNQKRSKEAIHHFLKAIEHNESYKGRENTIYLLAKECFELGEKNECLTWIRHGLQSIDNTNNPYYFLLMILKLQVEESEGSDEYLQFVKDQAIPYYEKRNDVLNLERCFIFLANYYSNRNQYKSASESLRKAYEINKMN